MYTCDGLSAEVFKRSIERDCLLILRYVQVTDQHVCVEDEGTCFLRSSIHVGVTGDSPPFLVHRSFPDVSTAAYHDPSVQSLHINSTLERTL